MTVIITTTIITVVCVVLFLLLTLLIARVRLLIEYSGNQFTVFAKLLIFKVNLTDRRRLKKQKKKKTKAVTRAKEPKKGGDLEKFKYEIDQIKEIIPGIVDDICINFLKAELIIATDDPFHTAMLYASSSIILATLLPFLTESVKIVKKDILLNADFTVDKSKIYFFCDVSIRTYEVILTALKLNKIKKRR